MKLLEVLSFAFDIFKFPERSISVEINIKAGLLKRTGKQIEIISKSYKRKVFEYLCGLIHFKSWSFRSFAELIYLEKESSLASVRSILMKTTLDPIFEMEKLLSNSA